MADMIVEIEVGMEIRRERKIEEKAFGSWILNESVYTTSNEKEETRESFFIQVVAILLKVIYIYIVARLLSLLLFQNAIK